MSEKLKKMNFVEGLLRKLRFCKWACPKILQIIRQRDPSRQLFETVNFAFIKKKIFVSEKTQKSKFCHFC